MLCEQRRQLINDVLPGGILVLLELIRTVFLDAADLFRDRDDRLCQLRRIDRAKRRYLLGFVGRRQVVRRRHHWFHHVWLGLRVHRAASFILSAWSAIMVRYSSAMA